MACSTLKRNLDCEHTRPNKRRCSSSFLASSASPNHYHQAHHSYHHNIYNTNTDSANHHMASPNHINLPPKETSPFSEIQPPLSDEVAACIKDEMKRLYHRKSASSATLSNTTSSVNPSTSSAITNNDSDTNLSPLTPSRPREPPVFTVRQAHLICERLIREREAKMREEYDKILANKLAEQYDTFVKFTYDQIQRRYEVGSTPSYLS